MRGDTACSQTGKVFSVGEDLNSKETRGSAGIPGVDLKLKGASKLAPVEW